ncbi:SAM-dependent methyltransferase [Actinomadura sp. HBU206391]|uniref:SAM-dependent methyltransferase n=1 Tax=Actinomadura sp. HBU206391 TaxID=2731692 RepID=UPI00164EDE77|nr:SAM-dependent methyltransferase [Actinomadura sp. HBU206391]MBC6458998.1 SAM-dependent methyltransferase [Actinomadura sp. HBU206391]
MTDELPPTAPTGQEPHSKINTEIPHAARIWNYWMGGRDNYKSDRAAGDAVSEVYPDIITMARESRHFLNRVVRYLAAEAGVRQFLDIGTGLPTMQNTHEIAQQVAPDSKIVYVDNDPLVLVHARALLVNTTPEGVTTYVDADFHDPDQIISDAANVLNLNLPVAVMFMGVLGYEPDLGEVRSILSKIMGAVPSGSFLVLWDSTNTGQAVVDSVAKLEENGAVPYVLRSPEALGQCFEGLELIDPGVVPITKWRAEFADLEEGPPLDAYGAVGRKP